jgi:hypothetical protein
MAVLVSDAALVTHVDVQVALVGTAPPSVRVVVVPETVAVTICPVVGAVAKPKIVLLVVAPLPQIVWALADPLAVVRVPAVALSTPRTGVYVSAGVAPARISPAAPVTAQVPLAVIVPPDKPVPQVTEVTVPVVVESVPDVGNVTPVLPVNVPVKVYAPEKAVFPPMVNMLDPLLTPVPPCVPVIGSAREVPKAEPVETIMPAEG